MNLVDGRAGKEPLLLLFGQLLLLALNIRTAGRFAQGRVEVLHVVGLELLHFHAADIGDNKVLDGRKGWIRRFGLPTCACCTAWATNPCSDDQRLPAAVGQILWQWHIGFQII